jgi:hypothetical protein
MAQGKAPNQLAVAPRLSRAARRRNSVAAVLKHRAETFYRQPE